MSTTTFSDTSMQQHTKIYEDFQVRIIDYWNALPVVLPIADDQSKIYNSKIFVTIIVLDSNL